MIGSGSGTTHFPSFIFNLPTLTYTSKPIYHLDAMYMPPTSNSAFTQTIPLKDKWILASDLSSSQLKEDTPSLINFLIGTKFKKQKWESQNPFKYIYTNFNSNKSRFLANSINPNILYIDIKLFLNYILISGAFNVIISFTQSLSLV